MFLYYYFLIIEKILLHLVYYYYYNLNNFKILNTNFLSNTIPKHDIFIFYNKINYNIN